MPIIDALAMNGEAIWVLFRDFDGKGLYGDGMNIYGYLQASPNNQRDPLGLTGTYVTQLNAAAIRSLLLRMAFGAAAAITTHVYRDEIARVAGDAWDDFTDAIVNLLRWGAASNDCYCMCIKPDPRAPGHNVGPDPIGRMTRSACKSWPYTGGAAAGYTHCFCKGDP